MVSKEIENVYKNRKNIRNEYISQDSKLEYALAWNSDSDHKTKMEITDEMRNNLKSFYINKIGEVNIENSPDYDVDLVTVDSVEANIKDLNFPPNFIKQFIKIFCIDLALIFFFGLLGICVWWIFSLVAWLAVILITYIFYADDKDDIKKFNESPKKSENEKQNFSRVKYASILAFIAILLLNFVSSVFI